MNLTCEVTDLLVFSHHRWDFVFKRPQHLLTRFARCRRVFYFEEPVFGMTEIPRLHLRETKENVLVAVPYLPWSIDEKKINDALVDLVDELIFEEEIKDYSLWYYTPLALRFSRHLNPRITIYDCMDELALCKGAPCDVMELETELFKKSDLVVTAGHSMYEAKKYSHHNIHWLASSVDKDHFLNARNQLIEPDDQIFIPHPRIGYFGTIDERFSYELVMQMADLRFDLQFIIIGPISNIDPRVLPKRSNIHYLGKKDYESLPLYLSGWDCAMMPFAYNEATRFISPSKTYEYIAGGKPVVSTSINEVKENFGTTGLVRLADTPKDFLDALDEVMEESKRSTFHKMDSFLEETSWDRTFFTIAQLELSISHPEMSSFEKVLSSDTLNVNGAI